MIQSNGLIFINTGNSMSTENRLIIGDENVTIEQITDIAFGNGTIALSENRDFRERLQKSRDLLEAKLAADETVYGVTTGYGDSCMVDIPKEIRHKLPLQLTRYHQCGLGKVFSVEMSRAIQLVRIISLSQGYSAVRIQLLEHMVRLFNDGVTARIPEEGSVGASGDLTPLSYYAATLLGEGDMIYKGKLKPSAEVYEELGYGPIVLVEKEALALMNGTAVMTAIACQVFKQAEFLSKMASRNTAISSLGLLANSHHFNETLFKAKPHYGTKTSGKWIRKDLSKAFDNNALTRLQDRYSIRCAPHIIGVLIDGLESFRSLVEIEINSANDNPLTDIDNDEILHGGNFYGGHIAFVMDGLIVLVANIADLLDRQMALLVDTKFNNGLPANLSTATGEESYLCHGLKALQISSSAWTAEALKNTLSASIFSRSTECHNQDKVSMGTIAARDALRVLELVNQVLTAALISSTQALEIRLVKKEITEDKVGENILAFHKYFRKHVALIENDRPLEAELRSVMGLIEARDPELTRWY
jgi:histidine ammonia-lyase